MKTPKTTQLATTVNALAPRPSSRLAPRPFHAMQDHPAHAKKANRTGLPDVLKTGIENLSGISLDTVKVHYSSPKPSELDALAYTQGNNIHVGPGQEKHLPHEAWHVVQQKQGRVRPTLQMKGGATVNDDAGLEHEADVMGAKALHQQGGESRQLLERLPRHSPIQRMTNRLKRPLTPDELTEATAKGNANYLAKTGHGRAAHGKRASSTPKNVIDRQAAASRQKAIDEVIQLKIAKATLSNIPKAETITNLHSKKGSLNNGLEISSEAGQVMQMKFSPEIEAVMDKGKAEVMKELRKAGFSTDHFNWFDFLQLSSTNFLYDNWATIANDLQLAPVAAASQAITPPSKPSVSGSALAGRKAVTPLTSKPSAPPKAVTPLTSKPSIPPKPVSSLPSRPTAPPKAVSPSASKTPAPIESSALSSGSSKSVAVPESDVFQKYQIKGPLGEGGSHHQAYELTGTTEWILLENRQGDIAETVSKRKKAYSMFPESILAKMGPIVTLKTEKGVPHTGVLLQKLIGKMFHSTRQSWAFGLKKIVDRWRDEDSPENYRMKLERLLSGMEKFANAGNVVDDFQYWVLDDGTFILSDVKSAVKGDVAKTHKDFVYAFGQVQKLVDDLQKV